MNITTKLSLASILALAIAAPVQAQNPKQGDYYNYQPWTPQQVTPGQERRIQQGDYYRLHNYKRQHLSHAQKLRVKQGDYYKPGT